MRADALLSQYGFCSRREAPLWVKAGRVVHGGVPVKSAKDKVEPEEVLVDGAPVPFVRGVYVAFNKPRGYTCSHREEGPLVYDLLPAQWLRRSRPVSTVGRLDKETSGLLLLSDDGDFIHALTSPRKHVTKVYEVETLAPIPAEAAALFASGSFFLEGEKTSCLPARLEILSPKMGRLSLREGRYHQVRRMLAAVGAPVLTLRRTAVGALSLGELALSEGEWKAIDPRVFL